MPLTELPSTIARRCKVDTRTVRRWCRLNLVLFETLPSGHYRVMVDKPGPEGRPLKNPARPVRLLGRPKRAA